MADPISIIGLVGQIVDILERLYTYGKTVKASKSEIADLCNELSAVKGILDQIGRLESRDPRLEEPSPPEQHGQDPDMGKLVHSKAFKDLLRDTQAFLVELSSSLLPKQGLRAKTLQALKWPFTKETVQEKLVFLERVKSSLTLGLMTDNVKTSDDTFNEVRALSLLVKKDHHDRRQQLRDEANEKIRKGVSHFDPNLIHNKACKAWYEQPQTGQWFLTGHFDQWLTSSTTQPRVIWLKGRSGAGKSVLFSHCVEQARGYANSQSTSTDIRVAFCYCSFDDADSQEVGQIMGSFVAQLAETAPMVLKLFKETVKAQQIPRLETLQLAISEIAADSSRVLLFVDAVNESRETINLLATLDELLRQAPNVSLMLTSTLETRCESFVNGSELDTVIMSSQDLAGDIRTYINSRISGSRTLSSIPAATKTEVVDALSKQADGMFRYVKCQMDYLAEQRTIRAIRRAIKQLPEDLNATYTAILSRIHSEDDRYLAREALMWLSYCIRPLRMAELEEAVIFEEDTDELDADDRLLLNEDILSICQGLVEINPKSGIVTLAHASVRTFLTSQAIYQTDAKFFALDRLTASRRMFRKCLAYLMSSHLNNGYFTGVPDEDYNKMNNFKALRCLHDYAATRWAVHAGALGMSSESNYTIEDREMMMDFFLTYRNPRHGNFGFWVRYMLPRESEKAVDRTQPLYYAASWGLSEAVFDLLGSGHVICPRRRKPVPRRSRSASERYWHIDARGGRGRSTALQVACYRGYTDIVKALIDYGANVNSVDYQDKTCLFWARRTGTPAIVKLLESIGAYEYTKDYAEKLDRSCRIVQRRWREKHATTKS